MEFLLISLSALLPAPLLRAPLGYSLVGSNKAYKRVGEMTEQQQMTISTTLNPEGGFEKYGNRMGTLFRDTKLPYSLFSLQCSTKGLVTALSIF